MSTLDRIRQIVAEELNRPLDEVTADKDLFADLGGDDLDRINLVFLIEDEFKVAISDEDMFDLRTVGDLVKLAERVPRHREAAR